MDELVSRQYLLSECDRLHEGPPGRAREIIEKAPAVNRWIPANERLPENFADVLVTIKTDYKGYKVRSGYYSHGYFYNDNGDVWSVQDEPLLAWMPQPEPYKEEREA